MSADQTVMEMFTPEQRIASLENALAHERELREQEQDAFRKHKDFLFHHLNILRKKNNLAKAAQKVAEEKRQRSLIKFVIIAASSIVLLAVPCTLQKLCIIGPQLSFGLQCGLFMVATWCYAIIWDREVAMKKHKKNAAPGWIRTGNGAQECTHTPNIPKF